ncbi:tRNA 2-thiouridine(34) synthase MnmA [Pajaroellobacter abortibovis]|uniref:tRNA-specific 2-thiouridylase MnmA n=1 Tax=Pajaroellobacter abortibovis TaxID=1882918 RepID=A0A1L6MZK3_9BACT|nr:tRNA 2-thiouridine(34) synthase MnmA [Pajaroellobacter abortibovis]APS00837.1 tRNA 2-thiouridine(34) synthase MnmA [Pajaroellobacter abortibovis]
MEQAKRVVMAMSGGVDSSLGAARLHEQGYNVIGVTLHLWDYPEDLQGQGGHSRCCAPEDQYDARRTADMIGFAHYTFDRRQLFKKMIINPFVDSYLAGKTPNPCVLCNQHIKLKELFALAERFNAAYVATGHYARIGQDANGIPFVAKGIDTEKDQSYFLYATPLEYMNRLLFPLGDLFKEQVRQEAIARSLPGATKGESQELCFAGPKSHAYVSFVENHASPDRIRPGPILDNEGKLQGNHQGIHRFTIGQRKGIGVALGKPAFVTHIDPETHTIRLGDKRDLFSSSALIREVTLAPGVTLPRRARVRLRYRHEGIDVDLQMGDQEREAIVYFQKPARAVTCGQTAVFYEGDRVLGGGLISRAIP